SARAPDHLHARRADVTKGDRSAAAGSDGAAAIDESATADRSRGAARSEVFDQQAAGDESRSAQASHRDLQGSSRENHFREGRSQGEVRGRDLRDGRLARSGRQGYRHVAEGNYIATHYRPPVGVPSRREGRWKGVAASLFVHALIILAILYPLTKESDFKGEHAEGGGGPGPAGGGGGGSQNRGERLQFVRLKPASDAASQVVPPKPIDIPKPVVPPVTVTPQAAPAPSPV